MLLQLSSLFIGLHPCSLHKQGSGGHRVTGILCCFAYGRSVEPYMLGYYKTVIVLHIICIEMFDNPIVLVHFAICMCIAG
jgi:hypothetical protein